MIYLWSQAMNAVPLSIPVVLSFRTVPIPYIRDSHESSHTESTLCFDSSIPSEELDCLIGMSNGPQRCGNEASVLNVKWQLKSGGQAVATGSSGHFGRGELQLSQGSTSH